jgi:cytochrome c biogenesis protein ResB
MDVAMRLSRSLWRFLTSARPKGILTAALLVALVIASLQPQFPSDSADRAPRPQPAALRCRQTARLIQLLWLCEAFQAPWYLVLTAGLLVNLVACTAQRLRRLWRVLAIRLTAAGPEELYRSHVLRQECPASSLREWLKAVSLALRASPCLYRLNTEKDELAKCAFLYAVRGRWSQAGRMVCHAATAVLDVAAVAFDYGGVTSSG